MVVFIWLATTFQVGYRPVIFQLVFRKRCFFKYNVVVSHELLSRKCRLLVFIEILFISVMVVINMSRQFFNTLSKTFILDLISGFCTGGICCTLSWNLERTVSILSTKYWRNDHRVSLLMWILAELAVEFYAACYFSIIMYFIRTRSTETTTHTIHNYHGTHYYQPCPGII